jgi:hypothetical protein
MTFETDSYGDLEKLATHLIGFGVRDHCSTALLLRAEWIVPKARRRLVHDHPRFVGAVMLTARPRWVERAQESASPRHNLAWGVWGATPRVGDPWLRFAGRGRVEARPASTTRLWAISASPDIAAGYLKAFGNETCSGS